MVNVSNAFKTAMKQPVKELDAYIKISDTDKITSADDLIQIKVSCDSAMCKTAMRKFEGKYLGDHDLLGKWVHVGYGVKIASGTFEYLDLGSFLISEITTVKDTGVTTITGYDQMIKAMVTYNKLNVDYPINLIDYTKALTKDCGLELSNYIFGDNLVDFSSNPYSTPDIKSYSFENDILIINGKNANYPSVQWDITKIFLNNPGKKLSLYFDNIEYTGTRTGSIVQIDWNNGTMYYSRLVGADKKAVSFTIPSDVSTLKYARLRFCPNNANVAHENTLTMAKPMLYIGDITDDIDYSIYNKMNDWKIANELWENIDGVTYRDILVQIAQATGTTCIIDNTNKVYFKSIYDTKEKLTYDNMLKLKLEPIYGEINSVVLSRTPQEDNIYMRDEESINENGLTEFKIENNEIIDKDRDNAMTPIYNALHGISYYPFETTTEGLGWYEIADKLEIDKDTDKNLLNINDRQDITSGYSVDKDGWITLTYDNTNGTSTKYFNFFTKNLNLKTSTKYNAIVEIKNVTGTGQLTLVSIYNYQGQSTSSKAYSFSSLSNNSIKNYIFTTRSDFTSISAGIRTYTQFQKGQSGSITFRLSVVEDIYTNENNFVYSSYNANKYNCVIFNTSLTIDGGIKEILKATAETKTQTQYQYATTIAKRVKNTEIIVNKQEQNITQLVSDMYSEDGIVKENFTKIYQNVTNIINNVQNSGGSNLIKNSVMFAYDNQGVPNDWSVEGAGNLLINSSAEALSNGSLSGHVFTLLNKKVRQRINVKVDNNSTEKTYYTFSTKIKKDTTGSCYVKLYNSNEEHIIELKSGESSFYGDYEIKALLPKDSYYDIEFYGSADSNATFTDNMLSIGEYKTQWSQASGEIMNTQVNINVDGVLVKSSVYLGDYTIMSPLEFAGYSKINGTITKVFSLNKDTTLVKKLEAEDEMKMYPIKIVPITSGSLQGWAFVPSGGDS